jgi:hypothetical protein
VAVHLLSHKRSMGDEVAANDGKATAADCCLRGNGVPCSAAYRAVGAKRGGDRSYPTLSLGRLEQKIPFALAANGTDGCIERDDVLSQGCPQQHNSDDSVCRRDSPRRCRSRSAVEFPGTGQRQVASRIVLRVVLMRMIEMHCLRFILLLSLMIGSLSAAPIMAEEAASREYQVKAAMIYNFAQFVEWPATAFEQPDSPLVISVVGANPFGQVLEELVAGKTVGGRKIKVRFDPTVEGIGPCHVLFVPASQDADRVRIIQGVAAKPLLTVGETDAFLHAGGIIRFYAEDNKVRFEINPEAAQHAKITISAKLLKLARIFKK